MNKTQKKDTSNSETSERSLPTAMEVDTPAPTPTLTKNKTLPQTCQPVKEAVAKPNTTVVKKKKKKASYKSMMASMTQGNKTEADIEKEKQRLKKVTGGGAFSKIDKI